MQTLDEILPGIHIPKGLNVHLATTHPAKHRLIDNTHYYYPDSELVNSIQTFIKTYRPST